MKKFNCLTKVFTWFYKDNYIFLYINVTMTLQGFILECYMILRSAWVIKEDNVTKPVDGQFPEDEQIVV